MKKFKKIIITSLIFSIFVPTVVFAEISEVDRIVLSIKPCEQNRTECLLEQELIRGIIDELYKALLAKITEAQETEREDRIDSIFDEKPLREGRERRFKISSKGVINLPEDSHPIYKEAITILDEMLTAEQAKYFEYIRLVNEPNSKYSAHIEQSVIKGGGAKSEEWELFINLAYVSFASKVQYNDALHTFSHEIGHLLLTNSTQVFFSSPKNRCTTHYIDDFNACAKIGSHLDVFKQYWSKDDSQWFDEYEKTKKNNELRASENLTAYYDMNKNSFVSEYATTSEYEDWAETVAEFVMHDKPKNQTTIIAQKINYLYTVQEMLDLRERTHKFIK